MVTVDARQVGNVSLRCRAAEQVSYYASSLAMRSVGLRASHVGITVLQNHSCFPTCVAVAVHHLDRILWLPSLCFFAARPIAAGQELTVHYWGKVCVYLKKVSGLTFR